MNSKSARVVAPAKCPEPRDILIPLEQVSQRHETCQWTEDENGIHETECGHAFEFTHDGVKANGFKYCCFCGRSIIVKPSNAADH